MDTIAPLLDSTQVNVCVTQPANVGPNQDEVSSTQVWQITVSYPYTASVPWLSVLQDSCVMPDGTKLADTVCLTATYIN